MLLIHIVVMAVCSNDDTDAQSERDAFCIYIEIRAHYN